ncbi:MAG: hypothetical protein Q8733_00305 [Pigeon pea little leaf phytoplasma]|nr:hypothetical protein [Pigeon pea little leaf phytoplasma]
MFENYLKNKIIKLLIAVFILFLSLNLFLIIFFQFNNNIKKTRLFSSNKNINNSEKLKMSKCHHNVEKATMAFLRVE